MGKVDHSSVAEVYARALFELAEQRAQSDEVEQELADLAEIMGRDADFATFMTNPRIDSERRGAVLDRLFRGKMSDTLLDTLQVLNRRGRMEIATAVRDGFHGLLFARKNRVDVHVTSAVPLDETSRSRLSEAVSARFRREAKFVEKVDPDLLGGMVVRIGDTKFDASVAHHLKIVHKSLKDRASNELHAGTGYVEGA